MEDGGWRMEDGGWRMEDGGWSHRNSTCGFGITESKPSISGLCKCIWYIQNRKNLASYVHSFAIYVLVHMNKELFTDLCVHILQIRLCIWVKMLLAVQVNMVLEMEFANNKIKCEEKVCDFIFVKEQNILGKPVQVANIIIDQMTEHRFVGDTLNEVD